MAGTALAVGLRLLDQRPDRLQRMTPLGATCLHPRQAHWIDLQVQIGVLALLLAVPFLALLLEGLGRSRPAANQPTRGPCGLALANRRSS